MRCCQIVPSLAERNGGPSKSVVALSAAIAGLGHEVLLATTAPEPSPPRDEGRLHTRVFRRDWPAALHPSAALRSALRHAPADVVHHHSIWLRTLHYAHRQAAAARVPLVISPRGMMNAWAWNYHAWRKGVARHLVHPGAFEAAAGWHATSAEEADEIRARGFTQPICVAPNGVSAPAPDEHARAEAYWREACPAVAHHPTAIFYSRFHRKKRVLELIDLWLARAPQDWLLLMVGLPDDYTPAQLETYVMRASGPGRVRVYDGEGRPPPYAVGSVFLLPSHSENFGLAIAEAMAHGLPALVTDTTPWQSLPARRAGWCVRWDEYPATLDAVLALPRAELAAWGERARVHALADFSWAQSAARLVEFYQQLQSASHG